MLKINHGRSLQQDSGEIRPCPLNLRKYYSTYHQTVQEMVSRFFEVTRYNAIVTRYGRVTLPITFVTIIFSKIRNNLKNFRVQQYLWLTIFENFTMRFFCCILGQEILSDIENVWFWYTISILTRISFQPNSRI